MKLFVWDYYSPFAFALAETKEEAMNYIMKTQEGFEMDKILSYEPKVYETPCSFVIWADMYDYEGKVF